MTKILRSSKHNLGPFNNSVNEFFRMCSTLFKFTSKQLRRQEIDAYFL